jgi:hypothetical protein
MDVDVSYTAESNTTTHNAIENSATFTTVCNHAFHMHCLLMHHVLYVDLIMLV